METGKIVQVLGPVVDVVFENGKLSAIKDALEVQNGDKKCVYCMHNYELGYIFLKTGNWFKGLKYCLAIFTSPKATLLASKKTMLKIRSMIRR